MKNRVRKFVQDHELEFMFAAFAVGALATAVITIDTIVGADQIKSTRRKMLSDAGYQPREIDQLK